MQTLRRWWDTMRREATERGVTPARNTITPRKVHFDFASEIPRYWFGGSPLATALANSLNLIFPAGERFFIRSVRAYLAEIDEPELQQAVRGFFGQESRHGREHERFFDVISAHGYDVQTFLHWYQRIAYEWIEPATSPALRLSVTAALEHFTAMFADEALREGRLEIAHPVLRDLLRWHAAEEIEHKAVAFDVLQRVAPGYGLRVGGLLIAASTLVGFWMLGAAMLLRQERGLGVGRIASEYRAARRDGDLAGTRMLSAFVQYLRPGFHPSQIDNYGLARDYLAHARFAESAAA